ncbi:MAG TPA: hypothetical protein EYN67_02075 [Flavobacteriales bacterium]|nr:hypothetical protein [Flavobacteriales bacterium]
MNKLILAVTISALSFNAVSSELAVRAKDATRLKVMCHCWDPYHGGSTLTFILDDAVKVIGQAAVSFEFGRAWGMASNGLDFSVDKAMRLYGIYCTKTKENK